MTRDEHRAKCIESIGHAILMRMTTSDPPRGKWPSTFIAETAFDALHGIAWVVPHGDRNDIGKILDDMAHDGRAIAPITSVDIFIAMSAAGDLTNPPEGEP
jgi:hypothetical protein